MRRARFSQFLPAAWLVLLAIFGGASRFGEWQNMILPIASVAFLLAALWTPDRSEFRAKRMLWIFLAVVASTVLVQLVPLPPSVWARFPGRDLFAPSASLAGIGPVWRPASLTPDLTWASLAALLPVATTLALAPSGRSPAVRPLLWTMTAVFFVAVVLGMLQVSGGASFYEVSSVGSAVGVFANRNHHAIFLSLGFPVIAYLVTTEKIASSSMRMMVGAGVGALYFVSIIQAGSRAGLVLGALMAGCVLAAMALNVFPPVVIARRGRPGTTGVVTAPRRGLAVGAVAVVVVIAAILIVVRSAAFDRLLQTNMTYDYRAQIFPLLIKMAEVFAPAGSGYGSFSTVFRYFEPFNSLDFTYLNQAHNDVLQVVIEGGVIGFVLMAAAAIGWAWRTMQLVRFTGTGGRAIGIVGALIVGDLFLASLVDYPLRTPLLAGVLTFAAVLMLRSSAVETKARVGR